ncbi:DNA topoisomerase IV [Flavobacteriaceae bacterium LMO-SS05]
MRLFILCVLFLSVTACYQNTRNCENFKTGNFKSEIVINGETFTSTFSRSETLQIETYKGVKDSSTVRWVNDCEVIFKTINPKNRTERKDIHLKILTTTDSSYTFEYSYVGETKKQKGIAIKTE